MKGKRRLKAVLVGLIGVALAAAVGWLSNANSKVACQKQVGPWLISRQLGARFFYLLDPDVRGTFDSIGANYTVLEDNLDDAKTWPRLSMKAHTLVPFFVQVDYFWEREAELGGGATKWFLSFFGRTVEIADTGRFAT